MSDYLHDKLTADCMWKRGRLVDRQFPNRFPQSYMTTESSKEEVDEPIKKNGKSKKGRKARRTRKLKLPPKINPEIILTEASYMPTEYALKLMGRNNP